MLQDIAKKTESYSGSDLRNLINEAGMMPIGEIEKSEWFHLKYEGDKIFYWPCGPDEEGAINTTLSNVSKEPMIPRGATIMAYCLKVTE